MCSALLLSMSIAPFVVDRMRVKGEGQCLQGKTCRYNINMLK